MNKNYEQEVRETIRKCFEIAEQEVGKNPSGDEDTRQQYVYSLSITLFDKSMLSYNEWRKIRKGKR